MTAVRMHRDEVDTDPSLVRRLLAAQLPEWAHLPIRAIGSTGTDHAIYRLGDDMAVRLPRIHWAVGQVEKERVWLPKLAPHLPLEIPELLATGEPGEGYPWPWSVHRWLAGESATRGRIADPCEAAADLAAFVRALQRIDASDGPRAGVHGLRGAPLATRDAATRKALSALRGTIDVEAATRVFEAALRAPEWNRTPVWFHGDLLPGNLLFEEGRLRAVIDFGGLGVGDPACDLMSAWGLFSGASREAFRAALGADEATWARGRGHALSQALIFLPYYRDTHPEGVRVARRTIDEILADPEAAAGTAPVSTGASR